ncbi:MAG: DUF484 family protein [Pseudomonadales bacterium]
MSAHAPLRDNEVVDYLREHPNFFADHEDLLGELRIPHGSGATVSLVERQLAILRDRNAVMRRRMTELMQTARNNDELFRKTRTLTLELLNVASWHALNEVVATSVLTDFGADFVCCHLTAVPADLDHLRGHEGALPHEALLRGNQSACITLRVDELASLFPGHSAEREGSAAVAPFAWSGGRGCLAIGSRNPGSFAPEMDTLFVTYIAEVISRVVQRLAD